MKCPFLPVIAERPQESVQCCNSGSSFNCFFVVVFPQPCWVQQFCHLITCLEMSVKIFLKVGGQFLCSASEGCCCPTSLSLWVLGQIWVRVGNSPVGARATSLTLSQRGEQEPATPDMSERMRHIDQLNSVLPEARGFLPSYQRSP